MTDYIQAVALTLLTVILALTIRKHNGELAIVLSIAACCMLALSLAEYLRPVIAFLQRLHAIADIDEQVVDILFKVVVICLIGEIASAICSDSGNIALGKILQLLATVVVLCLSVPMFEKLMELVESILGKL